MTIGVADDRLFARAELFQRAAGDMFSNGDGRRIQGVSVGMQCTCITFLHRKKVMQGYGSACVCLFWQHGNKLMADEVSWCAHAFQSDRAGVSILTWRDR